MAQTDITSPVADGMVHATKVGLARVLGPAHVWALGVGIVLVGEYMGWNFGVGKGGAGAARGGCGVARARVGVVRGGECMGWNFGVGKGGAYAALIACWFAGLLYTCVAMIDSEVTSTVAAAGGQDTQDKHIGGTPR